RSRPEKPGFAPDSRAFVLETRRRTPEKRTPPAREPAAGGDLPAQGLARPAGLKGSYGEIYSAILP
ncbi:MAG: hypothetical protein LBF61_06130, partial [Azoarcus sp.]|nr:hypothetical protein [Azoarcus sp.]